MQELHGFTSKSPRNCIHFENTGAKRHPQGRTLTLAASRASTFENTGAKRHPQGTNDFSMTCIRISNLFPYLFNLKMQTNAKAAQVYFKASKGPHPRVKTPVQKDTRVDTFF